MCVRFDRARSWTHLYAPYATVLGPSVVASACSVLVLMFGLALPVFAQSAADDDPQEHGRGAIFATPEELATVPQAPTYRAFLPERVDLSDHFPVPGDQGKQNSCVGWAVGYAARAYYVAKAEGRNIRDTQNIPSPAYIYNALHDPSKICASGSSILDALRLLHSRGAVSLAEYPYNDSTCAPPSVTIRKRASDFRISHWNRVDHTRLDQVKAALARGNPVVIGMLMTGGLDRLQRGEIYYGQGSPEPGGHAMSIVGYDERRQAFKVINSWGTQWADDGFGWIDYQVFRRFAREAFVMAIAAPQLPPSPPAPPPVAVVILSPPKPAPVVVTPPPPQPSPAPVVVTPSPAPPPGPVLPPSPIGPTPSVVLAELDCSQIRELDQGGRRTIVGFVGKDDDLSVVRAAAKGADVAVVVRPWPQCEALLTLDKPLSRSGRPRVMIRRSSGDALASGEALVLEVETPPFPSYLHIAYIQADGTVLNLVQPGVGSLNAHPPRSKIVIGDGRTGGPQFKVSAPFGREMLIVLAGRSPIFPDLRPTQETEREFLTALRKALIAKPDPASPDRDVTADYDTIITVERRVQ
jgi:hypothetical protein